MWRGNGGETIGVEALKDLGHLWSRRRDSNPRRPAWKEEVARFCSCGFAREAPASLVRVSKRKGHIALCTFLARAHVLNAASRDLTATAGQVDRETRPGMDSGIIGRYVLDDKGRQARVGRV